MAYMMKEENSLRYSSFPPGTGGTLGMYRGSKVISKLQPPPKIRVIHLIPPKIHHAEVADFRELVQRLTGKNSRRDKVKGKKVKTVKQEAAEAMIHENNNPTLICPKLELGSSPSSDHHHHHHHGHAYNWRPSSSSSSLSGDDHNNHDMFSDGGFLSTFEVDDAFDFTSLFGLEEPYDHDLNPSGEGTKFY